VDDATEDVIAADGSAVSGPCAHGGDSEMEAATRSGLVAVTYVLAKYGLELTARDDEEVVKAVLSGCPHVGQRVIGSSQLPGFE